ncbi:DUF3054 domain-containing protein [Kocuria varians]|nr:DUF3054 domain-containing protein [Kocuria varians]
MSTSSTPTPDSTNHRAPETRMTPTAVAPGRETSRWPLYLLADLVLVVVFAAIGRASHGEDGGGMFLTAWPFLVGTLVGWLVSRGARSPAALWPTGVVVWLATEVVGMLLRALTDQGTAVSFMIVSLVVLGVFLLGYRAIVAGVRRARRR